MAEAVRISFFSMRSIPIFRPAALVSVLLLLGAGCGSPTSPQITNSVTTSTNTNVGPTSLEEVLPADAVGTIQAWRGSLLGSSETDVWLVSHLNVMPGDRPAVRGLFAERGSSRRGNLMSQSMTPSGFTFSFNWGPEEDNQGYGTTTHIRTSMGDTLQGEVTMGSSTHAFTLYPASSLPSFALRRVATSTYDGDKERCSFSVEYPELLPSSLISQSLPIPDQVREAINANILQSLQSGTSTLPLQAQAFLSDCQSQLADLKKENPDALPESAFYTQTVEPDVAFANNQVISLVFLNYSYTGGAHGNYGYDAHTYDLQTGKELTLADLVQSDKLQDFYRLVSIKLLNTNRDLLFPETVTDIETFLKSKATTSTQAQLESYGHLSNWYLTPQGIVFFYNPYEIAPYAAGVQEITLPLSTWQSFAKSETISRLTP